MSWRSTGAKHPQFHIRTSLFDHIYVFPYIPLDIKSHLDFFFFPGECERCCPLAFRLAEFLMRSLWFLFTKCTFHCDAITIFLYHCYSQFNCTVAWCVQNPALWGQRAGQVWGGRPCRTGGHQQTRTESPPPKPHGTVSTSKGQKSNCWQVGNRISFTLIYTNLQNKARTCCQEGKTGKMSTENEVWASNPLKAFPQISTNVFAGRRLNLALSGPPSKMLPCPYSSPSGWGQITFTHVFLLLWLATTLSSVLHHMKSTANI